VRQKPRARRSELAVDRKRRHREAAVVEVIRARERVLRFGVHSGGDGS
jgi:hypothetical protein